jgi:hypothetical protein
LPFKRKAFSVYGKITKFSKIEFFLFKQLVQREMVVIITVPTTIISEDHALPISILRKSLLESLKDTEKIENFLLIQIPSQVILKCLSSNENEEDDELGICLVGTLKEKGLTPSNLLISIICSSEDDKNEFSISNWGRKFVFFNRCYRLTIATEESNLMLENIPKQAKFTSLLYKENERFDGILIENDFFMQENEFLKIMNIFPYDQFLSQFSHQLINDSVPTAIICIDKLVYKETQDFLLKIREKQFVVILKSQEKFKIALFFDDTSSTYYFKLLANDTEFAPYLLL